MRLVIEPKRLLCWVLFLAVLAGGIIHTASTQLTITKIRQGTQRLEVTFKTEQRRLASVKIEELEASVKSLRERAASFRDRLAPSGTVFAWASRWQSPWTVEAVGAKNFGDFGRHDLRVSVRDRNIAEWAALAQALLPLFGHAECHLREIRVKASGDPDHRRLDRVEVLFSVYQSGASLSQKEAAHE